MKEIQEIAVKKIQSMIDEGVIEKSIENGVQKAINSAISSQFKSCGNITKQIKESIEKGLKINIDDLPFESYNEQMLVAVKSKIGAMFQGRASEKFMAEMDKVLAPAPAEMSIKELVETVVGFWKSEGSWDHESTDEYATVELETWKHDDKDYCLKMWRKEGNPYSKNAAELNLFICSEEIRISHNQTYNPTCFSEHESFIFKLYAAGTTITGLENFDADDCDLLLKEHE